MKKLLAFILILSSFTLIACERDTTYDKFAQCLTDEGALYYGAFWCHNCEEQVDLFGDSEDLIPYIECDEAGKDSQTALCLAAGINAYPTWTFPDGSQLSGLQSLETLSEKTSCPLPGEGSVMF